MIELSLDFDDPLLREKLDAMRDEPKAYDELGFGLIAMDLGGRVLAYNLEESQFAGIAVDQVVGLTFFTDVAPCTNNYLVSGRFEEESELDETIAYVFTLRMRPTPVRLRLLKNERIGRQYLAVQRR